MKEKVLQSVVNKSNEFGIKKLKNVNSLVLGALVIAGLGFGCHFYNREHLERGMPPVNVSVAKVSEELINNPKSYVALVEAINSVDVVAKVSGSLDAVNFKEGGFVKKDDVLFVIDKDRYQAQYDLAMAQLESAKANLTRAERDFNRQQQLSAKNIASKATFDNAESAYLQAKAQVAQAKAQLELAKIDLDNTEVKAYIDGYIGKTKVTVGNYVQASAIPLARVVQINPIRVAFSLTDKEFLAIQAAQERDLTDMVIHIELANGEVVSEKLNNVFANNEITQQTATVSVYADVKNDKGLLKPGAYTRITITSANPKKGLVVPEVAIWQNDKASMVYVVDEGNVATPKVVQLGDNYDGKQVVLSGVNVGEKVITTGLQNRMLRPGANVSIVGD